MKGEHISESEKKQFISFLTRLNHVSIVFRCLGNEYIYKQYNQYCVKIIFNRL